MATKQQILQKLQSQNWVLTKEQKPVFKRFLFDYTVEPEDLPFLRKVAVANGLNLDVAKDTAFFDKIANSDARIHDSKAVFDREDLLKLKQTRFLKLKSQLPKKFTVRGYTIQVVDIQKIDGGIAVFARASNSKGQIGFGRDGSVDIERFCFYGNLQTLVPDMVGDIEFEIRDSLIGTSFIKRAREDIVTRLSNELAEIIAFKKEKFGPKNIVRGKIGNTTSTFYSDASGDGHVTTDSVTWATVRGATTGTASSGGTNSGSEAPRAILFGGVYYIGRTFTPFDTSALPDGDDITSVEYSLYFNSFAGTESTTLECVQTSQASPTALVGGDYDNLAFTSGGSISYPTATAEYKPIDLNATGLTWINKTGYTLLGAISGFDLNNSEPTAIRQGNIDYADGTNDPRLVIEHSSATTNTTNFFAAF